MKRTLLVIGMVALLPLLNGCTSAGVANMAKMVDSATKDPAAAEFELSCPYGTVKYKRAGGRDTMPVSISDAGGIVVTGTNAPAK